MHRDDLPQEKRAWRAPEIVDVGGVLDLTEGNDGNVRDPNSDPMTYNRGAGGTRSAEDEVDLGR